MKKKDNDNTIIFLLLGAGILAYLFFRKPKKTIEQVLKDVFSNLEFEFNKAVILDSSFVYLDELADVLKKTNWNLKLSGYTDNVGSESSNLKLSQNRANSVKNYLVNKGIDPNKIEAVGYGENNPIAPNDTAENRAKNRRVEFLIIKNK